MAITRDLFLAILALDSYNRGYNSGISGLAEPTPGGSVIRLGNAELTRSSGLLGKDFGFYATAYNWNGEKVISYRGTDNFGFTSNPVQGASDLFKGWVVGLGFTPGTQVGQAMQFYKDVTNAPSVYTRDASVVLTGHSLGGGLAGFVAALSGSKGVGFDHMPFGIASYLQYATDYLNGVTNVAPPNWDQFKGYFVEGEALQAVRNGLAQIGAGAAVAYLSTIVANPELR